MSIIISSHQFLMECDICHPSQYPWPKGMNSTPIYGHIILYIGTIIILINLMLSNLCMLFCQLIQCLLHMSVLSLSLCQTTCITVQNGREILFYNTHMHDNRNKDLIVLFSDHGRASLRLIFKQKDVIINIVFQFLDLLISSLSKVSLSRLFSKSCNI